MFAQLLPPPVNFYEGQSFAPDLPALKVTGVIKPPGALLTSFQFRGSCEYLRQEPPCLLIRSHRSTMFLSKGLHKLLDMFSVSPDNLTSLFKRGQEASVLRPQTVAQRVGHAFAAPYRIEFAEKLIVAHLRRAAAPQAVAQSSDSLA